VPGFSRSSNSPGYQGGVAAFRAERPDVTGRKRGSPEIDTVETRETADDDEPGRRIGEAVTKTAERVRESSRQQLALGLKRQYPGDRHALTFRQRPNPIPIGAKRGDVELFQFLPPVFRRFRNRRPTNEGLRCVPLFR